MRGLSWELLISPSSTTLHESINIATLCKVAPAELQRMLQLQSYSTYRSLSDAASANRVWAAPTQQAPADLEVDAFDEMERAKVRKASRSQSVALLTRPSTAFFRHGEVGS